MKQEKTLRVYGYNYIIITIVCVWYGAFMSAELFLGLGVHPRAGFHGRVLLSVDYLVGHVRTLISKDIDLFKTFCIEKYIFEFVCNFQQQYIFNWQFCYF